MNTRWRDDEIHATSSLRMAQAYLLFAFLIILFNAPGDRGQYNLSTSPRIVNTLDPELVEGGQLLAMFVDPRIGGGHDHDDDWDDDDD
jgi:hypothetical protein